MCLLIVQKSAESYNKAPIIEQGLMLPTSRLALRAAARRVCERAYVLVVVRR